MRSPLNNRTELYNNRTLLFGDIFRCPNQYTGIQNTLATALLMLQAILKKLNTKNYHFFLQLGFTLCKAENPLRGMGKNKEIKASTKRLKHTGNLFRKNLHMKVVC